MNPKELNKLKEVFLNSFLLEQMNDKIENKEIKDTSGFTILENDTQEPQNEIFGKKCLNFQNLSFLFIFLILFQFICIFSFFDH